MFNRRAALAAAVASVVASSAVDASCGSAFCMVNTNWGVQGVWNEPGFRGDLRFEYIDQDQPRTGTQNVAVGEIPRHHDEVRTINRNLFATLDYGFSEALGVKNLFDRDPPKSNQQSTFILGFDPSYYDPRGRFLYTTVSYTFK